MSNKYKNIVLKANSGDVHFQSPRALIAIFPYRKRKIDNISAVKNKDKIINLNDYLELRSEPIIITSEVLSLSISTKKQGISHNLSTILTSGRNFLSLICPGDYMMAWIVNDHAKLDDLIDRIQTGKSANSYDSGLKFFGKAYTIQEVFQVSAGIKEIRYRLNGVGFDQYNSQIYYSPFLNLGEQGTVSNQLFTDNFFKFVNNEKNNFLSVLAKERFSVHDQFIFWHKVLLGPGSGESGGKDSPVKTVNGTFGIPKIIAQLFNRDLPLNSNQFHTYGDLINVFIGVQKFDEGNNGVLGPDFIVRDFAKGTNGRKYGMYWEPSNDKFKLPGRKIINISPNFNGTIQTILQQHSNPLLNEMYFCLRPEPSPLSPIVPSVVCRQIPFTTNTQFSKSTAGMLSTVNISQDDIPYTLYLDLPRFEIHNSLVVGYEFGRTEALRTNCVTIKNDVDFASAGYSVIVDSLAISEAGWVYDANDVKRNGLKLYQAKIDQDYFNLSTQHKDNVKKLETYNFLISDFMANMHLRLTGVLKCVGIVEPICIGENLEYNDFVFHIEGVDHQYIVEQPSGITSFLTTLSLSHGTHKSGDLEAIDNINGYFRSAGVTNEKTKKLYQNLGGYSQELKPEPNNGIFSNKKIVQDIDELG